MASRSRVGVFGGTFDPIHHGHLIAAQHATELCGLDRVLFVVAGNPWQKVSRQELVNAEERLAMVERAIEGVPHFATDRREIDRGGLTYTIDTVHSLIDENPDVDYTLLLGSDAAAQIDSWNGADEIASLVDIAVVNRPGSDMPKLADRWTVTEVLSPAVDISSTAIRRRLSGGKSARYFVPECILDRVESHWG